MRPTSRTRCGPWRGPSSGRSRGWPGRKAPRSCRARQNAVEVARAVHRAERPGLPAAGASRVDAEPAGRGDRPGPPALLVAQSSAAGRGVDDVLDRPVADVVDDLPGQVHLRLHGSPPTGGPAGCAGWMSTTPPAMSAATPRPRTRRLPRNG